MQSTRLLSAQPKTTRREFVKASAVAAAGAGLVLNAEITRAAYAASSDTLRIGLVGCGGRGTGAAAQALRADQNTKLIAMGDAFQDHLERSLKSLKATDIADRVMVDPEHCFAGFDAYQQVIDSDVDIVLLATPPHFRPQHLRACIEAGKHVFAEKPVAVDAPGVHSVLESTELAKQKNLTLVSGLCWRYDPGMQETIARIKDGAIGRIVALETTRFNRLLKEEPRTPGMTDMEWQMRNWYNFTWLSGDFNVEQFVHELDRMAWLMGDQPPQRCWCVGGRQVRSGEGQGHIYDHFSALYEYADGVRLYASTRQQSGSDQEFYDLAMGTEGAAHLKDYKIEGRSPWKRKQGKSNMHQVEHDVMYAALRRGETINNGEYMPKSTMLAIMARMSAYTGKTLTWEQAMNSKEDLTPKAYDWDLPMPIPKVAVPGATPFV
jgi:predicted dehydrogenase